MSAARDETLERTKQHVSSGRASLAQMMAAKMEVRSEGVLVYDEDGREYLDCGGYGVFILGHRHPRVVAAVKEQLDRHPVATRELLEPRVAEAAEALARVAPEGLQYVFFASSGAEAVEAAIKLARLNDRGVMIAAECAFHGKTMGALSLTGREAYRRPFEPLVPEVERVAYGDAGELAALLGRHPHGSCAVVLEPVQAEAGVIVPPDGYLREVRGLCDRSGALLILDEVQTGLGRLGTWWGADRDGVAPDILLAGKGLSGGVVPVSATVCTAEVFEPLGRDPFLHTTTFGGSPLAMAAVCATLDAIEREDVVERAAALGDRLLATVRRALAGQDRLVADVRGVGLLVGIEFSEEHLAGDFTFELLHRRVIAAHSLNSNRVVRLTPPVELDGEALDWVESAIAESAAVVAERYGKAG